MPVFGLIVFLCVYLGSVVTLWLGSSLLDDFLRHLALSLVVTLVFMSAVFAVSRIMRRTDVVDIAWGPAIFVAALTGFVASSQQFGWNAQSVVLVLILLWSIRLSVTIFLRFRKKPEDPRYVALRKKWRGSEILNTFLRIFTTQGLLAVVIASAAIASMSTSPVSIGFVSVIGIAIWLVGFFFEVVGDWQLKRFLADEKNHGHLMTSGLWRYTRHPNYFGEATMWWGIFVIALSTPVGWVGIISPVVITFLLLFVSGVPMTENAFEGRKGWAAYMKRTSKFLPMSPRKV